MSVRKCECGSDMFVAIYPDCAYIRCVDDSCIKRTICVFENFYDDFITKYLGSEKHNSEIAELKKERDALEERYVRLDRAHELLLASSSNELEQLKKEKIEVGRKLTTALVGNAALESNLHEARVEKHVLCKKVAGLEGETDMTKIGPQHIKRLRHALGLDSKNPFFRNHFCVNNDDPFDLLWKDLIDEGFAWQRSKSSYRYNVYHVTESGKKLAMEES